MLSKEYATQQALYEVGSASTRSEALITFEENKYLLKDWRVIYADESKNGPFPLRRCQFSEKGFISTLFSGNSLWVLDHDVISSSDTMMFQVGYGTYIDSIAASFIRSLAYREQPKEQLLNFCRMLSDFFSIEELSHINPYLYLWEAQRDRSPETVTGIRETMAALIALPWIKQPLNVEWGKKYRKLYREQAESEADRFLYKFYQDLDAGLGKAIEEQVNILEAMLVRTKIIELSSKRSPQSKMNELVQFMHEELSTMMFRELIVCADIIFREGKSQMSRKLDGLQKKKMPFEELRNCARDLNMLRTMDQLTNSSVDNIDSAFYIANLITFDRDIIDILQLTELRAVALHRYSSIAFPIYNKQLVTWLSEKLGEKRFTNLKDIFKKNGFYSRTRARSRSNVKAILEEDKKKLASLIDKINN
ncbi:hypothetical protein RBG07_12045 [Klebsiella aerogenes]|uniref:hypothetical protein n=1 Tax=Klebsiella aerogenes TaxID=548 RepID=UPI0028DF3215|nr:hypothetical protein [Klebsiella aerogenes]MDT8883248.1 hypothetical protein [Klebsiella aerogenes]